MIFLGAGLLCLFDHLGQHVLAHILQLFLAGQDIHAQFLIIGGIALVHLIHQGDVLQQLNLMAFQCGNDLVDIDLGLVVTSLQAGDAVCALLEEAEQALLLFICIEVLQFYHQIGDHFAHFTQVLGADGGQCAFREIGQLFLCGRAVLQDHGAVAQVDLLCKVIHNFLFGFGEEAFIQNHGGNFRLCLFCRLFLCQRVQGQGGDLLLHHLQFISHCYILLSVCIKNAI